MHALVNNYICMGATHDSLADFSRSLIFTRVVPWYHRLCSCDDTRYEHMLHLLGTSQSFRFHQAGCSLAVCCVSAYFFPRIVRHATRKLCDSVMRLLSGVRFPDCLSLEWRRMSIMVPIAFLCKDSHRTSRILFSVWMHRTACFYARARNASSVCM